MQTLLFENHKHGSELEVLEWKEFHGNGKLWIDGKIAIVPDSLKGIYDYRTEFKGYEGKAVCRIGVWSKYYTNGQVAWQIDYGDGKHGYVSEKKFCAYRMDGTLITQ
jgi:antitoxin component YwqK of YwqJK toxin-antitoxin module